MSQDAIELTLEARTITGKQVRGLRREGIVPAVIHDHGKPSILVQGESEAFRKAVHRAGRHHPIKLTAAGKKYTAMIKDVDIEPKKQGIAHVVFNAVSATEKVTAEIPVRPRYAEGNDASPAERSGYMVLTHVDTVTVDAIASKLPDVIEYDAEKLVHIGDTVTVADLDAKNGVEITSEPTQAIAIVNDPAAVAEANDNAGGGTDQEAAAVPAEQGAITEDEAASQQKTDEGKAA